MNINMDHEKLISLIKFYGTKSIEFRQVANRLRRLLPLRLKQCYKKYKNKNTIKSNLLALVDETYCDAIEEYVNINFEAHKAKINYETHMMLYDARASLKHLALIKTK